MIVNGCHCHFLSPRVFETLGREKTQGRLEMSADAVAAELQMDPPGSAEALADRWVAELDRHHVTRAALIGSVPGDDDSIASAIRLHPSRFVGYFALNPTAPGALARARRAFSELSLRCVCLFPALHEYALDDESVEELFGVAEAHGAVVFAHCGYLSIEMRSRFGLRGAHDFRCGDPLALARVAGAFPRVPVIVPHFGGGFFREALMAADACPNIVFDTS